MFAYSILSDRAFDLPLLSQQIIKCFAMVDKSSTRYEVSKLDACAIFPSYKAVLRVFLKNCSVYSVGSLEFVLDVEGNV
jgi:hypothetical protein